LVEGCSGEADRSQGGPDLWERLSKLRRVKALGEGRLVGSGALHPLGLGAGSRPSVFLRALAERVP